MGATAHVSCNRTCELAMTRATGKAYRPCWHCFRNTRGLALPSPTSSLVSSSPAAPSHRQADESHLRMLTARAMTRAVVDNAMALCNVMSSLAHRVSGIVSVGEKAVALVMLT
jgi:hypothetical protein